MVTSFDGILEAPKELQEETQLTDEVRLRLVFTSSNEFSLERAGHLLKGWVPNKTLLTMHGMFGGYQEYDFTKARADERAWEFEHDEREFGSFPKR